MTHLSTDFLAVTGWLEYPINNGTVTAPCGCYACDEGVQPGHFACEPPPQALLKAEADGLVVRSYDEGRWQWFIV